MLKGGKCVAEPKVKKRGVRGFIERTLPGGKTGYHSQKELKKQYKEGQKKWKKEHPLTKYGTDANKPDSKFAKAYIEKQKKKRKKK